MKTISVSSISCPSVTAISAIFLNACELDDKGKLGQAGCRETSTHLQARPAKANLINFEKIRFQVKPATFGDPKLPNKPSFLTSKL